jgi:hypothetical protein
LGSRQRGALQQDGYQNDRGVQTAVTKRFSRNWEMQGTYTLAWLKDAEPNPVSATIDPATGYVRYDPLPLPPPRIWAAVYLQRRRSTSSRDAERRLAAAASISVERPLLLRIGDALRHGVQRRRAQPRHVGDNQFNPDDGTDRAAEQLRGPAVASCDMRVLRTSGSPNHASFDGIVEVFKPVQIT